MLVTVKYYDGREDEELEVSEIEEAMWLLHAEMDHVECVREGGTMQEELDGYYDE